MINDILGKEHLIEIDGKVYKLEFDNKAYAKAEQATGKGLFCLADEFLLKNNLLLSENIEIFCCGLIKNHSEQEIDDVKKLFESKPFLIMHGLKVLTMAFLEPLMPPKILESSKKKAAAKKKK